MLVESDITKLVFYSNVLNFPFLYLINGRLMERALLY